jgi:hypothetical protein
MKKIFKMPPMDVIVHEVNEILKRYPKEVKLTLRQIYYQLVAKHIIENDEHVYKSLSSMLVKARESGAVDDSRMEDRGRETIGGDNNETDPSSFYQEYEDFFRDCWKQYQRPMWQDQPRYVEVFVEKDALSRLVSDVASKFGVSTSVCKGYSSYTLLKNAANRIVGNCGDDRYPVILYFGDHDPSGVDMTRDLGARLERYGVPEGETTVKRVALLPEQIKQYNLPPAPVKGGDSRTKKFVAEFGDGVVELDALDANILQELVKTSIFKCINTEIWNQNARESKKEQMRIKEQVDAHFAGDES